MTGATDWNWLKDPMFLGIILFWVGTVTWCFYKEWKKDV